MEPHPIGSRVYIHFMPTDQVKNRSFKELLSGTVRFKIPFFQRGYAWEKKQWEQLFLDLHEQVITELDAGASLSEVQHFFGQSFICEDCFRDHDISSLLKTLRSPLFCVCQIIACLAGAGQSGSKYISSESSAVGPNAVRTFLHILSSNKANSGCWTRSVAPKGCRHWEPQRLVLRVVLP